ncbi:MAG: NAD-binding protein [Candidatus Bathyarchaeota archaeon]|nr:NAD-binding protein [Candidatus Bathyarchaeota archaeon]
MRKKQMDIIIGGGKYGCYAIEYLQQKNKSFVVVDTDPNCLAAKQFKLKAFSHIEPKGGFFLQGDLPQALELIEKLKPEYVFPTAPVHIAADLAKTKFKLAPWNEALNAILPKLPLAVILYAGKGKLITSFNRDHNCIDKCTMPKTCPTSQIEKPCTMTELMRYACPEAFILINYSMAPGMGALKGSELLDFFNSAETKEKFIVATTCDCHGVLNAYEKQHNKTEE